jgi:hypothetical protein
LAIALKKEKRPANAKPFIERAAEMEICFPGLDDNK